MKGNLADEQDATFHFFHRPVHHPRRIVKDPELNDLPTQPFHIILAIRFLYAHQHQEPGSNTSLYFSLYFHLGPVNPLYHHSHAAKIEKEAVLRLRRDI